MNGLCHPPLMYKCICELLSLIDERSSLSFWSFHSVAIKSLKVTFCLMLGQCTDIIDTY